MKDTEYKNRYINRKELKKENLFRLFFGMIPNDIPVNIFFPGLNYEIKEEDKNLKNKLYDSYEHYERKLKRKNGNNIIDDFSNSSNTPNYIFSSGIEPIEYNDFKHSGQLRLMGIENPYIYIIFIYNTFIIFYPLLYNLYNNHKYRSIINTSNSSILENGKIIRKERYYGIGSYNKNIYKELYKKYYERDTISNYHNNFNKNLIEESLIEDKFPYYMTLDIQSFFPSIYTHFLSRIKDSYLYKSLKEYQYNNKRNVKLINDYFKFLDKYNMTINKDETKGIIVGPLSSTISSELFSLAIYKNASIILRKFFNGVKYVRYMDDVVVFSSDFTKLHILHDKLGRFFQRYKLNLQDNKFKIIKGIYPSKAADFVSIKTHVPSLENKSGAIMNINDINNLITIKRYITSLLKNKKYSTVKAFCTILGKKKIQFPYFNRIYNFNVFKEIFINIFIKMAITFPFLSVSAYKLINKQIDLNNVKKKNDESYDNIILNELKDSLYKINKSYSSTVLQIWTYYLLNKIYNKYKYCDKGKISNSYENQRKLFNSYINITNNPNPLVIMSFISCKNDSEFNETIFNYIISIYIDDISRYGKVYCKNNNALDSIMNSKWSFAIYKLYSICGLRNKSMTKIFTTGINQAKKNCYLFNKILLSLYN